MSDASSSCRFFCPCKGEFYGTENSILSKKLLVVGASHYCRHFSECDANCGVRAKDEKCAGFTNDVIDTYLYVDESMGWKKTYTAFVNSVFGHHTDFEERCRFFQSVVFVNYLQRAEGEKGYEKHDQWFRDIQNADAFKQTIMEYAPDVIVVWGTRVWNALPWNDFIIDHAFSTGEVKKCSWQGNAFTLLKVRHPSIGYSRAKHYHLFQQNEVYIVPDKQKILH